MVTDKELKLVDQLLDKTRRRNITWEPKGWVPKSNAPRGARRRSPSLRPGAPPASQAWPSARAEQAPPHRAAPAGLSLDRKALQEAAGPRAEAGRRGGGTEARRRAVDRPGSPPRGRRDGGGDKAWRDSRAWWAPLGPSDGCDVPGRSGPRSPGTGSRGRGDGAPAGGPAGSCAFEPRPRRHDHRERAASPRGSRRTPGAVTFPRERAPRPRGPTGRADRRLRGRRHRRGPLPGSALLARRGRCRGGERSPRAAPARPPAAGPSSARRPPAPLRDPADTVSRGRRPAPA